MSFFKQFPTKEYDTFSIGQLQTLVDISRIVDVNDILAEDSVVYMKYNIIDGARPDIVSQLLYNTPEYYWTFFIANDHLKDGYRAWPKSEYALEKYIDEKYNRLAIVTSAGDSITPNEFPFNQYVSMYNKNNPEERIYFDEYDAETYTAKFKKVNDTDFNSILGASLNSISFFEFINPYNVFSAEYQQVELIRKQWNIDFYNYIRQFPEKGFLYFYNRAFPADSNIIVGSDSFYQAFADYMANEEAFYSYTSILLEKNAPHHYLNSEGERVSGYEAFNPNGIFTSSPAYVTNLEYEKELNELNREIKVIRPEKIDEFARRFKELINE